MIENIVETVRGIEEKTFRRVTLRVLALLMFLSTVNFLVSFFYSDSFWIILRDGIIFALFCLVTVFAADSNVYWKRVNNLREEGLSKGIYFQRENHTDYTALPYVRQFDYENFIDYTDFEDNHKVSVTVRDPCEEIWEN